MALQLDFTTSQGEDCTEFVLTDTTGTYSALTNPTGFGTPNPTVADIVTCTATITDPNGNTEDDIPCTLPSVGTQTQFDSSNLGSLATSGDITEGVWTILYEMVDTNSRVYSVTKSFLFYCSTQCCLDKAIADMEVTTTCTDCSAEKINTLTEIDALLKGAVYAAECNKPKKAQKMLDAAKFLCSQRKCSCD